MEAQKYSVLFVSALKDLYPQVDKSIKPQSIRIHLIPQLYQPTWESIEAAEQRNMLFKTMH